MSAYLLPAVLVTLVLFGPVLITRALAGKPEPTTFAVVTPPRFDAEAARAELVDDELLIVAALGFVPEQRRAGEGS